MTPLQKIAESIDKLRNVNLDRNIFQIRLSPRTFHALTVEISQIAGVSSKLEGTKAIYGYRFVIDKSIENGFSIELMNLELASHEWPEDSRELNLFRDVDAPEELQMMGTELFLNCINSQPENATHP